MEQQPKRHIAILGSTGSIGTQALDVIGQHEDRFQVELLTANNNSRLLIEQARRFNPSSVVICNPDLYDEVAAALDPLYIKVFTGIDSICELLKDLCELLRGKKLRRIRRSRSCRQQVKSLDNICLY